MMSTSYNPIVEYIQVASSMHQVYYECMANEIVPIRQHPQPDALLMQYRCNSCKASSSYVANSPVGLFNISKRAGIHEHKFEGHHTFIVWIDPLDPGAYNGRIG